MATASLRPLSKFEAWRNVIGVTLLGCLLLGGGCFVYLGRELPRRFDPFRAAAWQQVGFAAALGVILAVIVAWQRMRGESLRELGWGRPTTRLALGLGIVLGVLYLVGCYFGARRVLPKTDVLEFRWERLALAPLGLFMAFAEEVMMRGFFMTELERARVSTPAQVVASGACSAAYHAIQNPTPLGFFPSFVLFSVHAGLYVLGRRSLTPTVVAHGMYHVFGEPFLLMMAIAAMPIR